MTWLLALIASLTPPAPLEIPSIRSFMTDGPGARHEKAPKELEQFGRLAGVWIVDVELRRRDGGWQESPSGVWAWKYTLDGFAVSDLYFQAADSLPVYMANLGRDYLLTSNRIYDVSGKKWRVAWMANGAGSAQGADFGTFTAELEDGAIVMRSPPGDGYGLQRVVFSDITDDSFRWRSEFSTDDGETWQAVMRLTAKRHVE